MPCSASGSGRGTWRCRPWPRAGQRCSDVGRCLGWRHALGRGRHRRRHRRRAVIGSDHVQSRPKDWDAFFAAAPRDGVLPEGLARTRELAEQCDLVYLTGRPERCRRDTSLAGSPRVSLPATSSCVKTPIAGRLGSSRSARSGELLRAPGGTRRRRRRHRRGRCAARRGLQRRARLVDARVRAPAVLTVRRPRARRSHLTGVSVTVADEPLPRSRPPPRDQPGLCVQALRRPCASGHVHHCRDAWSRSGSVQD